MTLIVDCQLGNSRSVLNMLEYLGIPSALSAKPEDIVGAERLILPGVGTYTAGSQRLDDLGLREVIVSRVRDDKVPILGICLGMQLLGRESEEGRGRGLGLLDFDTVRFRIDPALRLKLPHMGWRSVASAPEGTDAAGFGLEPESRFYFVHSYHVVPDESSLTIASATYGYEFPAMVRRAHVLGVQFHPEKSHRFGMAVLRAFCDC